MVDETPPQESSSHPVNARGRPDGTEADRLATCCLTAEQYDLVHGDEDPDLVAFFLDALRQWAPALRSSLPGAAHAEGRFECREVMDRISASANYLEFGWITDLVSEQRAVLDRLESAGEEGRRDGMDTLTEGLERLALLLQPRALALKGVSLAELPAAPEAAPQQAIAPPPPEFDELANLGRTLANLAFEITRAHPARRADLRRQLGETARQIALTYGRVAASAEAGEPPSSAVT